MKLKLKLSSASHVVFCGGFLLALVAYVPPVMVSWQRLNQPPPIVLYGMRYEWVGPREFETTTDGTDYTNTCSAVHQSRYILLKDGGQVPVPARFVDGPRAGEVQQPRNVVNTKPEKRPGSKVRIVVPEWVDLDLLEVYAVTQQVTNNRPCADGWVGMADMVRLTIRPPSGRTNSLAPHAGHDSVGSIDMDDR